MNRVILTTNDGENYSANCVVSNKLLNKLYEMENMGGFKRFDVELYCNKQPKQRSETEQVIVFLTNVFGSNMLPSIARYLK